MSKHLQHSIFLVLAFANTTIAAEKTFDPATRAAAVAPYIDDMTRLVVHVDLERLQVEPSIAAFQHIVPPAAFKLEDVRDKLLGLKKLTEEPGFREFYVVFSLEDLPTVPFFIILPSPPGRPLEIEGDTLRIPLRGDRQYVLRSNHIGNMVFFATAEKFETLKTLKPTTRPELAEAFAAAGDTDVQAVLLSGDDERRVIEELYPTLPKQIGGGPSTIVTRGLRWAALGVDFPPQPRLQMTIQSCDAQAAQTLADKIGELIPLVAQGGIFEKKVEEKPLLADVYKAAALLKPTVAGGRIQYTLGDKQGETDAMSRLLAVPLAETLNAAWRMETVDKLKQLGLAMHNWHEAHKAFPAQASYDDAGRPLLSWRVLILPHLGESNLYKRFHLNEPWDSPNNIKLVEEMPKIYAMPNSPARSQGRTCFVRPVGKQTTCPGKKPIEIKEITDGTSNTIMIVEVDEQHAVIWTKPDDIEINLQQPANGLGGHFKGGFWTSFCDGAVHFAPSSASPKSLRVFFTRNGGENIDWSAIR